MLIFIFFCSFVSTVLSADTSGSGNNDNSTSNRIIGGHRTAIELYPHQVAINFSDDDFCGGFIISENYILTAASCIPENLDPSNVVVRAGSRFRNNGTQIPIAEVTPHPEYDDYDKNIAVMKTIDPIQFSNSIKPINLPPINRAVTGEVTVTGWGARQQYSSTLSSILMEEDLPVIDFRECALIYGETLTTNMWCAGDLLTPGLGACKGDTGGAAVQNGMAVGVVSFNPNCGGIYSPTVFTNLAAAAIQDFINKYTGS